MRVAYFFFKWEFYQVLQGPVCHLLCLEDTGRKNLRYWNYPLLHGLCFLNYNAILCLKPYES